MTKTCKAKTKSGAECQCRPMPNGRCRLHGGATPATNQNAIKHGIYSKRLTAEEQAAMEFIEVGTVDPELRLTRIRLAKALAKEHEAKGQPELDEVTQNDGGGQAVPRESRRSKVKDYGQIVDRLISRIESLEKTRLLLAAGKGAPNTDDVTRDDTFIRPDEPTPDRPIC